MPRINLLPKEIYSLIAAGEVVERPSSVVKEMLENSIDAGAERVTVEIRSGGVTFLRVTDDGCGIAPEDVRNAFVSHATSKIHSQEDLDAILTLGFRGEALASVASVAKVEMLTRTPDAAFGTRYVIACGEEQIFEESGCPVGTTLIVRDLFCNTPARMKFLKKDTTEGNYIADIVTKVALSHPSVSFRLIREGKETLFTPGNGNLYDTAFSLFGKDFAEGLTECDYELDGIKISGFITKPLFGRPNRNMQYYYVNRRYVRIPTAAAALDEAYKNSIMVGKFPGAVLNIELAPGSVDVNVHPAKTEIRFSNDRRIFEAVYYAAKSALAKGDTRPSFHINKITPQPAVKQSEGTQLRFEDRMQSTWGQAKKPDSSASVQKSENVVLDVVEDVHLKKENPPRNNTVPQVAPAKTTAEPIIKSGFQSAPLSVSPVQQPSANTAVVMHDSGMKPIEQQLVEKHDLTAVTVAAAEPECIINNEKDTPAIKQKEETDISVRVIGELFKTYILAEVDNKFIICDKHAAHERILFEKIKSNASAGNSQLLLTPARVSLNAADYDAVIEHIPLFEKAGYLIEDFGMGTVLVRGAPVELGNTDIVSVVCELAGELRKGKMSMQPEKLDWIYHNTACRAAIKAGDITSHQELTVLLKTVLTNDAVRYCPHGRPVLTEITKNELEKQFGRLG